jgi:hypothetical protein
MRLIQLLEQKNHYLEKFFALNDLQLRLLDDAEIDTLDEFYEKREKILGILIYIDEQLKEAYGNLNPSEAEKHEQTIQKLLFIKDEYVHRILDQEISVLAKLDSIKSGILSELIEIKSSQKAIRGYRSPTLSPKINEKA